MGGENFGMRPLRFTPRWCCNLEHLSSVTFTVNIRWFGFACEDIVTLGYVFGSEQPWIGEEILSDLIKIKLAWIFDRPCGAISKRQLDALMLTFIAAGIVRLKKESSGTFTWAWDLGWEDVSTPTFLKDDVWQGINLHDEDRPHERKVTVTDSYN
eukprot:scaffold35734_cov22-Cyclotella_meneghiniana.AAC.1